MKAISLFSLISLILLSGFAYPKFWYLSFIDFKDDLNGKLRMGVEPTLLALQAST